MEQIAVAQSTTGLGVIQDRVIAHAPSDLSPEILLRFAAVAAEIRKDLMVLTKRGDVFAGRHVDLEAFDTLAPYVDWRALVGLDNSTGEVIGGG